MIVRANFLETVHSEAVSFSVTGSAAWAPGIESQEAWLVWAHDCFPITGDTEPALRAMPAMQRRRVGFLARMALEVAYGCLDARTDVPIVFCSRHGEVSRSVNLLRDLACGEPLSPASFGLSVHNAAAGLFSIARGEKANHIAISGGPSGVEHAVIEACGLLADGEKAVLLVVYDCPLPDIYTAYQDCNEQAFAWAWLIEPPQPQQDVISLTWSATSQVDAVADNDLPAGLQILRFHLRKDSSMERVCGKQKWQWSRNA